MEFIIGLIIGIAGGIFLGYKGGIWLMNKKMKEENEYLKDQLNKVKELSNYWSIQATGRGQAFQSAIQNHNTNLNNTIGTVVNLLQSIQQQNNENLSQEDRRKVENIIQQAKGITSYQNEG